MSRTNRSLASRLFAHARLQPAANRHSRTTKLRLDSLEERALPNTLLGPLAGMALTFGYDAMRAEIKLPESFAPAESKTPSRPALQFNSLVETKTSRAQTNSGERPAANAEAAQSLTPAIDMDDLSFPTGDNSLITPAPVQSMATGGSSGGGGDASRPASTLAGQSVISGAASFDPSTKSDDSVGSSVANEPASRTNSTQPEAMHNVAIASESVPLLPTTSLTKPARVWIQSVAPENSVAGGVGGFLVWRDSSDGDLSVNYRVEGTARPADDYEQLSGRLVITDGNRVATIALKPLSYTPDTTSRDVAILLTRGIGYVVDDEASAVTQLGRPGERPVVSVVAETSTIGEKSPYGASVTFTRTTTDGPLSINYAVSGSARPY